MRTHIYSTHTQHFCVRIYMSLNDMHKCERQYNIHTCTQKQLRPITCTFCTQGYDAGLSEKGHLVAPPSSSSSALFVQHQLWLFVPLPNFMPPSFTHYYTNIQYIYVCMCVIFFCISLCFVCAYHHRWASSTFASIVWMCIMLGPHPAYAVKTAFSRISLEIERC